MASTIQTIRETAIAGRVRRKSASVKAAIANATRVQAAKATPSSGQRLIEHEQVGSPGQSHGERELRLLAAGQLADLLLQRDVQLGQPGLRPLLVPAPVQVAGDVQHV